MVGPRALTVMFYVAAALTLAAAAVAATAEAPEFVELTTFNVNNNNNNIDHSNNNKNGSENSHDDRRPTTGPPALVDQQPPQQQQQQQPQPRRFRHEASAIRVIYQTGVNIYFEIFPPYFYLPYHIIKYIITDEMFKSHSIDIVKSLKLYSHIFE